MNKFMLAFALGTGLTLSLAAPSVNADPIITTSNVWSPMFTLELLMLAGVLAVGAVCLRSRPALAFGRIGVGG